MVQKLILKKSSDIFPAFVSLTISYETGGDKHGGYTNDPVDPGGETRWGISKRTHPTVDIKNLTYKGASAIYEAEYFYPILGTLAETHPNLAFKVFDMGVLMGPKTAVKWLQKALNSMSSGQIRVDGDLGLITLSRIITLETEENAVDNKILNQYIVYLRKRILWLTSLKPWLRKYKVGWLKRINIQTTFESKIK